MDKSNDERLLDLRALVRSRFARDLRTLAEISDLKKELSLADLLDEVHNVYVHYLQQNALLDNASTCIHRKDSRLTEELNRLRSIDGN
jgi:hypothetical protein